jgi:hypothetical protein
MGAVHRLDGGGLPWAIRVLGGLRYSRAPTERWPVAKGPLYKKGGPRSHWVADHGNGSSG